MKFAIAFLMFGSVAWSQVPAQFSVLQTNSSDLTCVGTVPCGSWPMPAVPASGSAYSDLTWATTQYRLAQPAINTTNLFSTYSRVQPWNSDGTRLFMAGDGVNMDLYDATTTPPTPINRMTLSTGDFLDGVDNDVLWSNTNPNIIYFNVPYTSVNGLKLYSIDVSTCTSGSCVLTPTLIHTFACTSDGTEGNIGPGIPGNKIETGSGAQGSMFDKTDRYFAFSCDFVDGGGRHEIDLIRYDKQTDTVTTQEKWYNVCPGAVATGCQSFATIKANIFRMNEHSNGNYISIIWQTAKLDSTWVRGSGTEIYDPAYTFIGPASAGDFHQDMGYDVSGNPVWVGMGSHRNNLQDARAIEITNLLTLSPTAITSKRILLPCSYSRSGPACDSGTQLTAKQSASHISMTGTNGTFPGYGLVSTMTLAGSYGSGNNVDWPPSTTLGTTIVAGTATVTPASMANIAVGVVSLVGWGTANKESVTWTAATPTTATAVFANNHASTETVSCLSCGDTGFGAMENLAVKIDTSATDSSAATFYRVGRTMAIRDNCYNCEPHTAVNRDFTQMVWGTTWNVDPTSSSPSSGIYGMWLKLPKASITCGVTIH